MAELIWEGKYDENGKRRGPLRVALPFQTVETVNESAQERQKALDMFGSGESEWRNRLIWGDKKYVLPSLLPEFAGKVDLIYIDPPFNTDADFSMSIAIHDSSEQIERAPNAIEQKAYRDTWGRGLDSYVAWLADATVILKELLSSRGSLYLHLDYHVSHYGKVVLDDVFGPNCFQSEITWKRTSSHNDPKRPGNIHDTIFFYSKDPDSWTWNPQYQPLTPEYVEKVYVYADERGRYRLGDLTAPGISKGLTGKEWRGVNPTAFGRHWRRPPEELEGLLTDNRIQLKKDGAPSINGYKQYLADSKGMSIQSIWADLSNVTGISSEKVGYPTQKPSTLLDRIISASSNSGDLILDCFCGSGTTAAVAEKLGRRWITCDLGRFAIHTARKRLLAIEGLKPFLVQNLGKYERSEWQKAEFGENADQKLAAYRKFILDLYKARELRGHAWIHGVKGGRMVHVGSVDSPVSTGDVTQIAKELRQMVGTGEDAPTKPAVDVLGWDFAFNINELATLQAKQAGIDMKFIVIPREVLEKKAVEQGDIHFYELAHVALETKVTKLKVDLSLKDFVMSLDDVPEDVRNAVTHWGQWIDYWAVDWDHKEDTFHNQWQAYRTKKEPKLKTTTEHTYAEAGDYTIMVKVIDILGNDTTKVVTVKVS